LSIGVHGRSVPSNVNRGHTALLLLLPSPTEWNVGESAAAGTDSGDTAAARTWSPGMAKWVGAIEHRRRTMTAKRDWASLVQSQPREFSPRWRAWQKQRKVFPAFVCDRGLTSLS